ncbi:DUF2809 domain-containing protein [Microbacterium sp.]|uniref:DUF2809 domain-containing protein n=1 Tax=Microbacterium sp. TaxID=51671 RepID=UPI0039E70BD5
MRSALGRRDRGGVCVAVELFQLTGVPQTVGAAFPPAMLVLGTVFDARDLAVYPSAIAVLVVLDALARRRSASRHPRTG